MHLHINAFDLLYAVIRDGDVHLDTTNRGKQMLVMQSGGSADTRSGHAKDGMGSKGRHISGQGILY